MATTTTALGRRARFAAAVVVVISAGLFLWSVAAARDNRAPTGGGLGADYLAFHNAGDLLRRFGPGRLYDLPLQSWLYHDRLPGESPDEFLPYVYAPHVAAAFVPFSLLPYRLSYVLWTLTSVGLYAAAVAMAVRAARLPAEWRTTAVWLAAAFEPFAFECIHGGQVSTVAAAGLSMAAMLAVGGRPFAAGLAVGGRPFAAGLAVGGRPFAAGLAVGCCCYKPTLLVVLVPGLVVTRRWRTLAGCVAAGAGCATVDVLAFGVGPCRAYVWLLAGYAGHAPLVFRTWKFADVHSFAVLLGASPGVATAVTVATIGVAVAGLRRPGSADDERLFWAAALAWTPVANRYAGIYDAVLVVPAAVLAAGVLGRRYAGLPGGFVWLLAAVWLTPWVTSAVAQTSGLQVFTAALVALGIYVGRRPSVRMALDPDADEPDAPRHAGAGGEPAATHPMSVAARAVACA